MLEFKEEVRFKALAVARTGDSPRRLAEGHAEMGMMLLGYLRCGANVEFRPPLAQPNGGDDR